MTSQPRRSAAAPPQKNVILGTAGHIDHGKSSLVKALTGIDPDRLKEEKERGITIDLGFGNLSYPDGVTVGIVDVPGHERLIKNMLAGAGGIDILMMVIAADEGIMPQSREHLAICEMLKIKSGFIALTKADLVDPDWIELVSDEIRAFVAGTFLEGADIVPVSAKSGSNIDLLKVKIHEKAMSVQPKLTKGIFRLPIDRVFTLKGFGTVVTGTALSGTITLDSAVEILPSRIESKVRGLQTHGAAVESAFAGQRIGINLQGVDRDLLNRGDVVVPPGRFVPTAALDAKLDLLKDSPVIKSRSRVHFYCGTAETVARVILYDREELSAGESCFCQFRLEHPLVALSGDRYIIRRFSPLETIGGGGILDPHPIRRKRKAGIEDLVVFERGLLRDMIEMLIKRSGFSGCTIPQIEGWVQGNVPDLQSATDQLIGKGIVVKAQDALFHKESVARFRESLLGFVAAFHRENPLKQGVTKEELKAKMRGALKGEDRPFLLVPLIPDIVVDRDMLRLASFSVSLTQSDEALRSKIIAALDKDAFQPPSRAELAQQLRVDEKELGDLLKLMVKEGQLVRINDSLFITVAVHGQMIERIRTFAAAKKEMTVAEFRDILETSRKYALPLLEYLDSNRITLRVGDVRKFMLK
ncbi:MAG TPA: selenocysteine-specific translation elongation factor [Dissulfurispiraceae bacterium]|nr:selenocysteine-specific translation elongation factor [Dissulfurispiraceae bacterium]